MPWMDKPHSCELPEYYYGPRIGMYWECEHCKRSWAVVSQAGPNEYGQYIPVYVSRIGDYIETRIY